MKKRVLLSLLVIASLVVSGCAEAQKYTADEMQLRKEIGQLLIVGIRGTEISDTSHIVRDITEYNVGGVILFEYDVPSRSRPRNITSRDQLKKLCADLQRRAGGRLLIGIDQEGGMVSRLKQNYGFPLFPSAKKTAQEGDKSVRETARLTAATLADLNINLDFAPCVDVDINPDCPVIGKLERSFSGDAKRVARCGAIWVEELEKKGVIACLKHFPGHGSSRNDTHLGVADVSDSWMPSELEPYRALIADGNVTMIMTTHVFNAQFDSVYPATLSYKTLTGLLRDSLHYDGVIVTDDMAMGAMTQQYNLEEALTLTLLAGADMLCLSNNGAEYNADIVPQVVDMLFRKVKEGVIPAERIHDSYGRMQRMKKAFNLGD
ncbi:MAG: glycoside hydrolase family 3 protein [Bacteroidales bacterium]|nr:glycoside hydrolase family 3 protein [Bacteroidales bacterium]